MVLKQTPSQTVGPFFSFGLAPEQYGYDFASAASAVLADAATSGTRIRIVGRVMDGEQKPLGDALVEIWQADGTGRYDQPVGPGTSNALFSGFGRMGTGTDPEKRFIFETVMPGAVATDQAPHVTLVVFARGMLNHLYTRMYFSDMAEANASDPVLQTVPPARRHTLIARREQEQEGLTYHFDIRLQGENETVFFDV